MLLSYLSGSLILCFRDAEVLAKEQLQALATAAEGSLSKKPKLPVTFQRRLDTGDADLLEKEKKQLLAERER